MKKALLLLGAAVCFLVATILFGVSFTGGVIYEDVDGALCLTSADCKEGMVCCPVSYSEAGICYVKDFCSSVYYFSDQHRIPRELNPGYNLKKESIGSSFLFSSMVFYIFGIALIVLFVYLQKQDLAKKNVVARKQAHK
jgi:hypothetical protein